jgi:hypothetical protein
MITITELSVESEEIRGIPGLDPVQVFWTNFSPKVGSVTITCYGSAWTAYFGGMPDETIREFFRHAGVDYLLSKLGISPHLKERKSDMDYLRKIITGIKENLK